MTKNLFRSACCMMALFLLTACGEGWEMQLTNTAFPYGNQRTAGSGVMYVRAKLLPKKELNIVAVERAREPVVQIIPQAPAADQQIKTAEPIFKAQQAKQAK